MSIFVIGRLRRSKSFGLIPPPPGGFRYFGKRFYGSRFFSARYFG